MKKVLILLLILLVVLLAACGGDAAIDPEAIARQASDVASEISDAVEDGSESEAAEPAVQPEIAEETLVEMAAPTSVPAAACDPAAVPAPSEGMVTVRFVNNSGAEMNLLWHDLAQPSAEPANYGTLAIGGFLDQPTFAGHEWLMEDPNGHLLKVYSASAAATQCVIVDPHFAYEGEDSPENWAELSDHYEACGLGQEQSPIDLTAAAMTDLPNIAFAYGATPVYILNNGHTIQVDKIEGNSIQIDGVPFNLLQFHFHAPSEHTVDGQSYPIEMHLVHRAADGRLAVVGVLVAEGAENSAFVPVWDHLPEEENGTNVTGATVQVADLLPADQTIYRYDGSLTTPPCSENVIWSVMKSPVEMSAEQIAALTALMEGNNRPLQPLNERSLQFDQTP